jgi:hypothetical protein
MAATLDPVSLPDQAALAGRERPESFKYAHFLAAAERVNRCRDQQLKSTTTN